MKPVRALRAHKVQQAAERLRAGSRWVDHDLVFTTRVGTAISASNLVNRNFKPLLDRAGLPGRIRFQDLRHSAATLLLAQGVPLRVVSAMLGHSTMRVTERYAAVVPELHAAAAAAMDRAFGN
jgi:integrase